MRPPGDTQRPTRLPWLRPAAESLLALADADPCVETLTADPAVVLLAMRLARPSPTADDCLHRRHFLQPILLDAAAAFLDAGAGPVAHPDLAHRCQRIAATARDTATRNGGSPSAAYVAGLLAPLGELVGGGTDLNRRLTAKWRLPRWLADVIGNLAHTTSDAVALGADPKLFEAVRAAVGEHRPVASRPLTEDTDPLLSRLLRTAARARRVATSDVDDELDALHRRLVRVRSEFADAVRDARLDGLAELAAGAGHEINNPLAVIIGHAQRLRQRSDEPDRLAALDAIVRQSKRIADILHGLRQFARPPQLLPTAISLAELLPLVVAEFEPQARLKRVGLSAAADDRPVVVADSAQLRRSIGELVRNAIEATPTEGHVWLTAEAIGGVVRIAVEDTGPGPDADAIPRLFDPFYSGRDAGRGRGLGLSVAWRFATRSGGTIRLERPPGGPTRFVLQLPSHSVVAEPARKSA